MQNDLPRNAVGKGQSGRTPSFYCSANLVLRAEWIRLPSSHPPTVTGFVTWPVNLISEQLATTNRRPRPNPQKNE